MRKKKLRTVPVFKIVKNSRTDLLSANAKAKTRCNDVTSPIQSETTHSSPCLKRQKILEKLIPHRLSPVTAGVTAAAKNNLKVAMTSREELKRNFVGDTDSKPDAVDPLRVGEQRNCVARDRTAKKVN